jgi:hypothetical protein
MVSAPVSPLEAEYRAAEVEYGELYDAIVAAAPGVQHLIHRLDEVVGIRLCEVEDRARSASMKRRIAKLERGVAELEQRVLDHLATCPQLRSGEAEGGPVSELAL